MMFLLNCLLYALLCTACSTVSVKRGYVDSSGVPLTEENRIIESLDILFSGSCPQLITVSHNSTQTSQFHTASSTVSLGKDAQGDAKVLVLRHETAHLCMAQLTKKASTREQNRFYDEGFASIVGGDYSTEYRKRALAIAARKANEGEVSFLQVQRWNQYFGTPPHLNYEAYSVGVSFVYFAQETYGQKKLFEFFRATGESSSLEQALLSAFNENLNTVEEKWLAYLRKFSE